MANSLKLNELPNLNVVGQNASVLLESLTPYQKATSDYYDAANWLVEVVVDSPADQDYIVLFPYAKEQLSSTKLRLVSDDNVFDEQSERYTTFKQVGGKYRELAAYVAKMGLQLNPDGSIPAELAKQMKSWQYAVAHVPAGRQKLRLTASHKVVPVVGTKNFEFVIYAPLPAFTVAGGQTNFSVTLQLPADWEQTGIVVEEPVDEQIPGQPQPQLVGETADMNAARQAGICKPVYSWHWRNDPKVTVRYRYQ